MDFKKVIPAVGVILSNLLVLSTGVGPQKPHPNRVLDPKLCLREAKKPGSRHAAGIPWSPFQSCLQVDGWGNTPFYRLLAFSSIFLEILGQVWNRINRSTIRIVPQR